MELSLPYLQSVSENQSGRETKLAHMVKWLLVIYNGDWRSPTPIHHCKLGCECKCESPAQLRLKAMTVFVAFVMGSRPAVPALSRWLKCVKTARWYWTTSAIHGLLQRGYEGLYGLSHSAACEELTQEMKEFVEDGRGALAPARDGAASTVFSAELPVPKILRVRALRSVTWLLSDSMLVDLCVSICSTRPAEHMLEWLFKQQHDLWLHV